MRMSLLVLSLSVSLASPAVATPTPEAVKAQWRSSDAVLLDRHGAPVQALRIDRQGRRAPWVALADMSPALPLAVLQAEDQRFMEHDGVDVRAMGQAAWDNLFRARPRGASTITMQLAGLLDPALKAAPGGRTLRQKWDQVQEARALDAAWSKAQILEAYLNLAAFRGELQGVGAAAQALFGKAPSGLDVAESAILASLLRGPSAARPAVVRRACALAKELKAATPCADIGRAAQHAFSRQAAMAPLPPAREAAARLLQGAGDRVASTLDGTLQRHVQAVLRQQLMALRERHVADGAVLVLDNASGEILAWVGNAGGSEVDGVTALRQAGSTLKPFLYALALERRQLTAASVLDDMPLDISTPSGLYAPQNYEQDFKGHVTARASLAADAGRAGPVRRMAACAGVVHSHGAGRFLRAVAGIGFGRREPAGTDQCLSRAGERRHGRRRHVAAARAAGAGAARVRRGCGFHRGRHPGRPRRAGCHVRPQERAGRAVLGRRQDRHQQGHAR
jgi:penicillin-binding protein 1C